jgi:hypothetical protein
MAVEVTFKGPIFDGSAEKIVDEMLHDASVDMAEEAFKRVRARLKNVLKHPTGYYESRVSTDNTSTGAVISDGGVIYGPWLEGVSSRNNSTRFKGYHTFRMVAQSLGSDVEVITDRAIQKNIGRLQ